MKANPHIILSCKIQSIHHSLGASMSESPLADFTDYCDFVTLCVFHIAWFPAALRAPLLRFFGVRGVSDSPARMTPPVTSTSELATPFPWAAQTFWKWSGKVTVWSRDSHSASCACVTITSPLRAKAIYIDPPHYVYRGGALFIVLRRCAWLEKVVRRPPDQPDLLYAALDHCCNQHQNYKSHSYSI